MCVAQPSDRQISFYKSFDLVNWQHLSNFGPAAAVDGIWECPDLFPLEIDGEEVWVLLVSLNPGGLYGSGTQYFVGDFDGQIFTPRYSTSEPRWLDYGKDNYAGVTFNGEPNGRRIFIGWMANWSDVKNHPDTSWTCQMTVPRLLGLTRYQDELVVTQQPICKETYEILETIPESGTIELTGFAKVGYNADRKVIFINEYEAPYVPKGDKIHLKVLVDMSSIELFSADGIRSISLAVFPLLGMTRELKPASLKHIVL
jgi:sucrose-6-phosphate hydrolase SacC (GH32 family)